MNLLSINSISNNSSYAATSSSDVSQLEAEEASLQKQLQQVNSSKDDDKTKQAKIKELEAKIQEIQAEISQKKSMKTSKVSNGNQQSSNSISNNSKPENSNDESQGNIIDTLA